MGSELLSTQQSTFSGVQSQHLATTQKRGQVRLKVMMADVLAQELISWSGKILRYQFRLKHCLLNVFSSTNECCRIPYTEQNKPKEWPCEYLTANIAVVLTNGLTTVLFMTTWVLENSGSVGWSPMHVLCEQQCTDFQITTCDHCKLFMCFWSLAWTVVLCMFSAGWTVEQ